MIPEENCQTIFIDEAPQLESKYNIKKLKIIHFNDVYNIEGLKEEPVGGAARFYTAINSIPQNPRPLVVFSGDAVSPSTRNSLLFLKID
jgi:hypothetical protein